MNVRMVWAAIILVVPVLVVAALAAGSSPRGPENVGVEASPQRLNEIRGMDPNPVCMPGNSCQCAETCPINPSLLLSARSKSRSNTTAQRNV